MHWIEIEIRKILVKCLVAQSEKNDRSLKDTQIMFYPAVLDDVECRYGLLNDYVFDKELKYSEVAGLLNLAIKPIIEGYVLSLYGLICENEGIEVPNIQIIIQATKTNPGVNDLVANLFDKGKLIRELNVSEFIGKPEVEEEHEVEVKKVEESKDEE